jgi:ketosteroid isomerase-like protein
VSNDCADEAIRAVYRLYAAIDAGDVEGAVGSFTADAVYRTSIAEARGTREITEFFDGRINQEGRESVHILANVWASSIEPEEIVVEAQIMLYDRLDGPASPHELVRIVASEHHLRLVDGNWLIAHR